MNSERMSCPARLSPASGALVGFNVGAHDSPRVRSPRNTAVDGGARQGRPGWLANRKQGALLAFVNAVFSIALNNGRGARSARSAVMSQLPSQGSIGLPIPNSMLHKNGLRNLTALIVD